jgi:hypothetical protein
MLASHDPRIIHRGISLDRAVSALKGGKQIGDLIIATPRIADSLLGIGCTVTSRFSSSFEFSRPARSVFTRETAVPECSAEVYVAGELTAPIAFRFTDCEFMHVNMDAIFVEIANAASDAMAPSRVVGPIVVTDLLNTAMPLIRYRLGDFGSLTEGETCPCGRVTPRLKLFAREFHASSETARRLEGLVKSNSDPSLLVHIADNSFVLYVNESRNFQDALDEFQLSCVEVRDAAELPDELTPLVSAKAVLSIAERPMPHGPH